MIGKIFDRMEAFRSVATKTELVLIDKIKDVSKADLIYLSITELADMLKIGEATILRFCRKLGLKGFQDFKLTLSQDMATETVGEKSTPLIVAESMSDAIFQTEKEINYSSLLKIANLVIKSNHVCAFGMGNSSVAPLMLKNRLIKAGIFVENTTDTHSQAITVANLNESDVLFLFSVSGSTLDMIRLGEMAKQNKTSCVVITNYSKSPLAKNADIILQTSKKEAAYEGGSLSSVVSQAYIVDILCTAVFEEIGNLARERAIRASSAVSDKSV